MTRLIGTLDGDFTYEELAPKLALGVERTMKLLAQMPLEDIRYTSDWLCNLHREAFKGIIAWAGQVRKTDVSIRNHMPPPWYYVPSRLHQFAQNLEIQADGVRRDALELDSLAQVFAYAEGEFTNIHPFEDFNGRVSRMLAWSLVLRFGLPAHLELVPRENDHAARQQSLDALEDWDNNRRETLMLLWYERLVAALTSPGS